MCSKVWKVCENFREPMEIVGRDLYFSMLDRTGLCVGLKINFFKSMGLLDSEDCICFHRDLEGTN